ncbi:ceramide kinase [Palaemon carinicauda]|uniref:ceramide kinase n=1 Tax=Palaemon carinicauda TaxID=392227 RepID=UPI0035B594D2
MSDMHLQGTFYILNKRCKVTLTDDGISWEPEGTPDLFHHVAASELVGCWLCPKGSSKCCLYAHPTATGGPLSVGVGVGGCKHFVGKGVGAGLTLEYCERDRGLKWKVRDIVLHHAAPQVLLAWHHALWTLLNGIPARPKRLLVIVNPVGGRRKAYQIYNHKVAPLFRHAAIHTRVILTEYRGHGRDLVENGNNLAGMDGVVVVGGDGLVNEVVTGLLLRAAHDSEIDPHQPDVSLPQTQIRVGIIPGGSTDATCHGTHGTSDIVTAALHIIMGDCRNVDVAAVHAKGRLQCVATTMVSYGYFGDLLETSERWRKLGPSRYLVSGVLQFLRNRSYEGQLSVLTPDAPLAEPSDSKSCCHQCSICTKASKSSSSPGEWKQFTGRWSVVTSAVVSCACRLTPHGISPSAHLGDGCTDLILVSGGSRFRILSYLYRTSCTGNALSLNHVKVHRVKEVHFTPKMAGPKSTWNCDGEQLDEPALRIKIHCQCVQMFCRGIETWSDSSKTVPKKSP